MRYDIHKRLFLTKKLVLFKSVRLVQRAYRSKFKNRPCPTAEAITKLSKKIDTTWTILDLPPKPKNERNIRVDARNKLKVLCTEDPRLSIRKASVDVEISNSLCRDILLKDLQLKPFKYQSAHHLFHLIMKKGNFCSMVAGLGKGCSQMVKRYWWNRYKKYHF